MSRWLVALCGLVGCIPEQSDARPLPQGVDVIAKIGFGLETRAGVNDGGLTLAITESDSTGFASFTPGAPLITGVTEELAWFAVAYRSSDLEGRRGELTPAILSLSPLRRANTSCGLLPPPPWSAPLTALAKEHEGDFSTVELRTDWSRVCPVTQSAWLDIRCPGAPACGTLPRFSGCEVRYDTQECLNTVLTFEREFDGGACFAGDRGCTAEPNEEGGHRWICPQCEFDTYAPRATQHVRADLDMTIAATLDRGTKARHSSPWPTPRDLERGAAAAMSVRDNRLWIAPRGDVQLYGGLCGADTRRHDGALHIYGEADLRPEPTLMRTATPTYITTAPHRCYSRLVPDPHGPGMLATYHVDNQAYVGRLDAEGRTVQEVRLPRGATSLPVAAMSASLVTSSELTAVVEILELAGDLGVGAYHVLDSRTLTWLTSQPIELPLKGLAWVLPAKTEVDVVHTNGVVRLDARTAVRRGEGTFTANSILDLGTALARAPLALPTGQVLLPDSRLSAGVALFAMRLGELTPLSFSRVPGLTSIILQPVMIPGRTDALALTLVPGEVAGSVQAAFAWIELSPDRARVRPGIWVVDSLLDDVASQDTNPRLSVLTQPVVDEQGRLWVLAPWEGRVLRFDTLPRP